MFDTFVDQIITCKWTHHVWHCALFPFITNVQWRGTPVSTQGSQSLREREVSRKLRKRRRKWQTSREKTQRKEWATQILSQVCNDNATRGSWCYISGAEFRFVMWLEKKFVVYVSCLHAWYICDTFFPLMFSLVAAVGDVISAMTQIATGDTGTNAPDRTMKAGSPARSTVWIRRTNQKPQNNSFSSWRACLMTNRGSLAKDHQSVHQSERPTMEWPTGNRCQTLYKPIYVT